LRIGYGCRLAALFLALVLAAACAPFQPGLPSDPASREGTRAAQAPGAVLAREALAQVGAPYRYGGAEPARGFDCSGLVSYVHAREGIAVPRTAAAQFAAARKVDERELQPGDLVFFRLLPGSRDVTHVGIYTGQRRFVHAPQSGRRVGESSLDDPFYREHFAGSGRFYGSDSGTGPRLKSSPR
jgi:cell wall-associated NlpC family hydrolase